MPTSGMLHNSCDGVNGILLSLLLYSFDNAEVYAKGKAEEIMGQAIKVRRYNVSLREGC